MGFKVALLIIFVAATIYIGFYSRKKAQSVDGFVLGGRKIGPWMSAFAYGTSYFSAVVFIGYAGQFGWKFGLAAFWAGVGNVLIGSLLAWFVLGRRTRIMTNHLDAKTMPEFFGKRFDSNALRIASALIIFVFLIPYTASVYNGLSRLFGMAFGLPYEACIIAMAVVTCIYVIWGGYTATALNDTVQGIIMLVSIIAVILCVLGCRFGIGGFRNIVCFDFRIGRVNRFELLCVRLVRLRAAVLRIFVRHQNEIFGLCVVVFLVKKFAHILFYPP